MSSFWSLWIHDKFPSFPVKDPLASVVGLTCYPKSIILCSSFEMSNINNTHLPCPFDKVQNLEAEVERLTYLLSAVVNRVSSAKPIDPAIFTSSFLVPITDPEVGPITLVEAKSKMESLRNQIKLMKETHTEKLAFRSMFMLRSWVSSLVPNFENMMRMAVCRPSFIYTE